MAQMNRFSLYYRLMDICLIIQIAALSLEIGEIVTGAELAVGAFGNVVITFFLCALLLPIFLIFARFMRDDFSEQIWQKTAGTVLKALTVLPPIVAISVGLLIGTGNIDVPATMFTGEGLSQAQGGAIFGVVMSLIYIWVYTPMIFTFAFQWHRWRASR